MQDIVIQCKSHATGGSYVTWLEQISRPVALTIPQAPSASANCNSRLFIDARAGVSVESLRIWLLQASIQGIAMGTPLPVDQLWLVVQGRPALPSHHGLAKPGRPHVMRGLAIKFQVLLSGYILKPWQMEGDSSCALVHCYNGICPHSPFEKPHPALR